MKVIDLRLTWPALGHCGIFWFKLVSGLISSGYVGQTLARPQFAALPDSSSSVRQPACSDTGGCSFFYQPISLSRGENMATNAGTLTADGTSPSSGQLVRAIDWKGAFWVASGVPALVLFSIGGIAGVAGKVAFLVWFVSMIMGLIQSFTYAEIAGLFPNKSGGASVYGAAAW
ncbi:MAG: amino acid permease, partial [Hyphomicrobium sp.]